ncbi:Chitinase [uncultured Candidatus Thioglobus sp.]|nr:Chitinase [uncultured Candidatus Thioglobus sp.]
MIVNDGNSDSPTDSVTITVTAGDNDAPTADAGTDQTVDEGNTVTLMGTASDPEAAALTYSWMQNAGDAVTITLSDDAIAMPTFTAPTELLSPLSLNFTLTVSDGVNTVTDTVMVTVNQGSNDDPTADAGTPQTVAEMAMVTLDGSASSDPEAAAPGVPALTYSWTQTAGDTVVLTGLNTVAPTFTAPNQLLNDELLVFELIVNDGNSDSPADSVTITVTAGDNDDPTADAGTDQTVDEGNTVTLMGTASDPEAATLTYSWMQNAGDAVTITLSNDAIAMPTFTAPTELLSPLSLNFTLTVSDGVNTVTDTVMVTVNQGSNDAPTADAGANQTVAETTMVTLDGSASSDPESAPLTYSWTQDAGITVVLTGSNTVAPTFTAPDQLLNNELLTFQLVVSDGNSNSALDTVTIIVFSDNGNVARMRNAALNQSILPIISQINTSNFIDSINQRMENHANNRSAEGGFIIAGRSSFYDLFNHYAQRMFTGNVELYQLLDDTSFIFSDPSATEGFSIWGNAHRNGIDKDDGALTWSGDVFNIQVGTDMPLSNNFITGISLSWLRGKFDYRDTGGTPVTGEYDYHATTIFPYVGWSPTQDTNLWLALGYGWGEIEIEERALAVRESKTDFDQYSVSIGGNHQLYSIGNVLSGGQNALSLKGDITAQWTDVDRTTRILADIVNSQRVRLLLEASHKRQLNDGGEVKPSLNIGLRHDGGDGETGAGVEVASNLLYTNLGRNMVIEAEVRSLLAHEYDEWGAYIAVTVGAGAQGQGFALRMQPTWGTTQSSRQQLWENGANALQASDSSEAYNAELKTEISHGMLFSSPRLNQLGLFTPYLGFNLVSGSSDMNVGSRLQVGTNFTLDIQANRVQDLKQKSVHKFLLDTQLNF